MSKPNEYPEEVIDYIKANVKGTPYKKLAEQLNATFGANYTYDAIKRKCRCLGLSNYINKWSEEEKEYLQNNQGKPYKQLAEEVSKVIGVKRTEHQVSDMCIRMGIKNGRDTRFSNGHKALNAKPIGHIQKCGRKTYIKVQDTFRNTKEKRHGEYRNYRLLHEYLWEQEHGKIPRGHYVVFMDGDRTNFDIDNLVCIPNAVKQRMNKLGWQYEDNPLMRGLAIRNSYLDWMLKKQGVKTN